MDVGTTPDIAREIAIALMSPQVQWINWLVLMAIVAIGALIHVLISWLKKSAEIKAVTERLDEVIQQVAATTRVQEEIKQGLADSIWKDQKRWERELELYHQFLVTLGKRRKLQMAMKRVDVEGDEFESLNTEDQRLEAQQTEHFQAARILMPEQNFLEFRGLMTRNFGNPMFANPPNDEGQFHAMLDAQIEVLVDAENSLAQYARQRLGTDIRN